MIATTHKTIVNTAIIMTLTSYFLLNSTAIQSQSTDNTFLQSLQQEAEQLQLDADTEIPPEALERKGRLEANPSETGGGIAQIKPGMSVQQFEQVLKLNYMGSYLFYKRLNNQQKDAVFQFYEQYPDSKMIREEILRLSKQ